jgi:hypothetical protein
MSFQHFPRTRRVLDTPLRLAGLAIATLPLSAHFTVDRVVHTTLAFPIEPGMYRGCYVDARDGSPMSPPLCNIYTLRRTERGYAVTQFQPLGGASRDLESHFGWSFYEHGEASNNSYVVYTQSSNRQQSANWSVNRAEVPGLGNGIFQVTDFRCHVMNEDVRGRLEQSGDIESVDRSQASEYACALHADAASFDRVFDAEGAWEGRRLWVRTFTRCQPSVTGPRCEPSR